MEAYQAGECEFNARDAIFSEMALPIRLEVESIVILANPGADLPVNVVRGQMRERGHPRPRTEPAPAPWSTHSLPEQLAAGPVFRTYRALQEGTSTGCRYCSSEWPTCSVKSSLYCGTIQPEPIHSCPDAHTTPPSGCNVADPSLNVDAHTPSPSGRGPCLPPDTSDVESVTVGPHLRRRGHRTSRACSRK